MISTGLNAVLLLCHCLSFCCLFVIVTFIYHFFLPSSMKEKISISIEADTLKEIEVLLENPNFRNKSHVVEFALNKLIGEMKDE